MKAHGLLGSKADFWIHLHPLEDMVYWYRTEAMRLHIALCRPAIRIGKSKDPSKTASGAGYAIAKSECFILRAKLEPRYCRGIDWLGGTDRENGRRGELVIGALLDHGIISLMRQVSTASRNAGEQFASIDGSVTWQKKAWFEAKTETYVSENLFVQTHESGHQPHYTADGLKRVTSMPLFKEP